MNDLAAGAVVRVPEATGVSVVADDDEDGVAMNVGSMGTRGGGARER